MKAILRWLLALLAAASLSAANAQQIRTFTENTSGSGLRPIGYPVPLPVASLTPVEGFRDYASLEARLQSLAAASSDLEAHEIGRTFAGRRLWAYRTGTVGDTDVEGRAKPAFFINATTHAREWAAPEVSTFLVERMVTGADDAGLTRYLLDNTRLVIIPVHNVDGLLQTQRFPTQAIVGQDPRVQGWPRDGRMRRKNMRGADEVLTTFPDHLQGIDLNRNHPPFWATSPSGSSNNPADLVYHGSAAHSEPENEALRRAADLAPVERLRLGIDIHTFSRVFFSSNTGRPRLNAIQSRLIGVLGAHHSAVPTASGAENGKVYTDVPDPPNRGIGAAAEYFAYQWLVPAWTLELEPGNDEGAEYGGNGSSHSGFILPAREIRRVREAWAETHLVAFYFMAGPPHLARVRVRDAASGALLSEQRWRYEPTTGRRTRVVETIGSIAPGQVLRVELGFSKPMRHRRGGVVTSLPGNPVDLSPRVWLRRGDARDVVDVSSGEWLINNERLRYRDDSFAFTLTAPAAGDYALEVDAADMAGLRLDTDPATPVDWREGAWAGWNGDDGNEGDIGGADRITAMLTIQSGAPAAPVTIAAPGVVAEGDALRVRLQRGTPADGALRVELQSGASNAVMAVAEWATGETGARELQLSIADDVDVQGNRPFTYRLVALSGNTSTILSAATVDVLDNDLPGRVVLRDRGNLQQALARLAAVNTPSRELVLDGGVYRLSGGLTLTAPLRLFGNRAQLHAVNTGDLALQATGTGTVELLDLSLGGRRIAGAAGSVSGAFAGLENTADRLVLRRAFLGALLAPGEVAPGTPVPPLFDITNRRGELIIERTLLDIDAPPIGDLRIRGGRATLRTSTLAGANLRARVVVDPEAEVVLGETTLVRRENDPGLIMELAANGRAVLGQSLLQSLHPAAVSQCSGTAPSSSGGNLGQDASCGLGGADRPPTRLDGLQFATSLGGFTPLGAAVDAGGTDCGPVDQRGAPRPQTMTAGAEPRCDIGAIELGINPWRGFWIPQRAGHGLDMQTSGNTLFILWYTYGDDGQPTTYQAAAPLTGPRWQARLLLTRRDPGNGALSHSDVGTIGIDFSSDIEARLSWRFDVRGREGSETIRAYAFASGEPRFEVTGTWFPPAESGNGASISRRGETTALVLYYYDAAGNLRWALGNGDAGDAVEIELFSFTGFCPDCDAQTMPVRAQSAGRALLHFLTPERLHLDSDVSYPGAAGGRWQRQRAAFVPLSDPVDNRAAAALLP